MAIVFSSCSNNDKEIERYKALNESLEESNKNITNSTEYLYKSLEEKLSDPHPQIREWAQIWQPKAEGIHRLSDDAVKYFNGLKKSVLSNISSRNDSDKVQYDWTNTTIVKELFDKPDKYKELDKKLREYIENILNVDSAILENKKQIGINRIDKYGNEKPLSENLFDHTTAISAVTMMNKFVNIIRNTEYKTVAFCYSRVGSTSFIIYRTVPLITQSANCVQAGDEIKIVAGVGACSNDARPTITIQEKNISLNGDAVANYKFKASKEMGKHIVPVKVDYIDQNGVKHAVTENIEYTVVKELQTSPQ